MGLFDGMLKNDQSLFRDEVALSFDYMPKLVPFREDEQRQIASCIKPLFDRRNGRNIIIHGPSGIGKTVATRHVLNEINDHTDEIIPIYVNCWKKNTSYKVLTEICELIGYKFTQNKNTQDLFSVIKERLNKYSVVFCFDEVDKLEGYDFFYFILEEIYRSSVVMLTNFKDWHGNLDSRIRSRLTAQLLEFKPYGRKEIEEILRNRLHYAFVGNVFSPDALKTIIDKTDGVKDIRSGLYLIKESGLIAEGKASKSITIDHVNEAIGKLDEFSIKEATDLEDDTQFILEIIKEHTGKKIGEIFEEYQKKGGERLYKSFQRRMNTLAESKFISLEKKSGFGGMTKLIHLKEQEKKLTDFKSD